MRENDTIANALLTIARYKGNVSLFRKAVVDHEYTPSTKHFLRLLLWKVCLITESLNIHQWLAKLADTRVVYHKLSQDVSMEVPWWLLDPDDQYYMSKESSRQSFLKRRGSRKKTSLNQHILSMESANRDPLQEAIADPNLELLQSIILDVDRLFPGEVFFHSLQVKQQLIQILFVWSKCNPQIGYKQGIHEILGLIYLNMHRESVDIPVTNTISPDDLKILQLYDTHYLAHDIFTIFNMFMIRSSVCARFYEKEQVLWKSIEDFNVNLMKVDQLIHYNLVTKLNLELQLWIIRYLRLLLLREIDDLTNTNLLWDKLVAVDVNGASRSIQCIPDILVFVVIVMLIHIKTNLMTCDFSEALSLLLHYPISEKLRAQPDLIHKWFEYAIKLYDQKLNDMKLYELGIKLNKKFNPNLRFSMSYTGSPRSSTESVSSRTSLLPSPAPGRVALISQELSAADARAERMRFEKLRMEMRLKKRAQQLTGVNK